MDSLLHLGHRGAEVGAFEAAGDDNHALQVFAANLVLRRKLLDGGERAERCGVSCGTVEDGILDGVERFAVLVAQAHTDGVRPAIGNQRIICGQTVEDRRRIFGNFGRRKSEPSCNGGVDLEVGRRSADGVIDTILYIDHAGNLADGIADSWAELGQQGLIVGEDLDLDRLWCVGQIADHVLQHLDEFDVEFGLGRLDLRTNVFHDFVDAAAAL